MVGIDKGVLSMKKEVLQSYYDDIKKERDIRMTMRTDQQRRIQKCNAQLLALKTRIREMEE